MICWNRVVDLLIEELIKQANQVSSHSFFEMTLPLSEIQQNGALAWLKEQKIYPQFYFQQRDTQQRVIALGSEKSFTSIESAEKFLNNSQDYCNTEHNTAVIVGGMTFDKQSHFYIPSFLMIETSSELVIRCNSLHSNVDQRFIELEKKLKSLQNRSFENISSDNLTVLSLIEQKPQYEQWQQLMNDALGNIEKGEFSKVVLARRNRYQMTAPINAYDLLINSHQYNQNCYHFLWAINEQSAFVGSTPERLYQRNDKQLLTEALAGTVKTQRNQQDSDKQLEWLMHDDKNNFENRLVVDDILEKIMSFTESIGVSALSSKRLNYVQHLQRTISAQIKEHYQDGKILKAIHPSAAVCGLPYTAAYEFIQKNELFERGWYAGTLGIISQRLSEFCVTIRSAIVTNEYIDIYTGAGIVENSDIHSEWLELDDKAQGLLALFNH